MRGMAGRKVRFRGIKHTTKRLEGDILETSQTLRDNPGLLRPKCAGKCFLCPFNRTFARISHLQRIKDDPDALVKAASRGGDDIYKAYAATISLCAAGGVPFLATAKLGGEEVSFAQRGSVGNDKLIGAQHYQDPKVRLLLYNTLAKKKHLHIYSFGDDVVCSKKPNMPIDYIYDTFWDSPYEFKYDEIQCGHADSTGTLVIHIKSADKEVRICRDCAKDVSTLQYLISRMVAVNPLDDFDVYVEHKYHGEGEEGKTAIPTDKVKEYASGKITDVGILNSVLKDKIVNLKKSETATYIIGTKNYGSDLDTFLGDLKGTEIEIKALRQFLTGRPETVITRTEKASEALNVIWVDNYNEIIAKFTTQDIADSFGDVSKMNASQTVTQAYEKHISSDVISKLPDFGRGIGTVTRYADTYAKAAKIGGTDKLKDAMLKLMPKDSTTRSLADAFCIAVSGTSSVKCSKNEKEFSVFLLPFVKQLVAAEGKDYRDKMNTLLTACGCGESV
jgi:hypothetical protein